MTQKGPIGVFDSGYGGLTVLRDMVATCPTYDYIYLGDNARNPYGPRSFEVVYRYTLQAVKKLFSMNCPLVILACNTASAKALRSIQQRNLPTLDPTRRVLGVIRPCVEAIGTATKSRHVGVLATQGTVASNSYVLETRKLFPDICVVQHPCPMWVPLVEFDELNTEGADYFIRRDIETLLAKDPLIDCIILGCTHYPLMLDRIEKLIPKEIAILSQGPIVARSLADYLVRHPEIACRLAENAERQYFTTESAESFERHGKQFMSQSILAVHLDLP